MPAAAIGPRLQLPPAPAGGKRTRLAVPAATDHTLLRDLPLPPLPTPPQARVLAQAPAAAPAPLEALAPALAPMEAAPANAIPTFTLADLAENATPESAWLAIEGKVYDVRWGLLQGGDRGLGGEP